MWLAQCNANVDCSAAEETTKLICIRTNYSAVIIELSSVGTTL